MSRESTRAQRDWLENEVAAWQRMGVIAAEQAQTIRGLYESPEIIEARQHSKGLFTLLALAATFVGLGVFLLIGYNWELMPAPFKVAAIFATLIGTHAGGLMLRYQYNSRRPSEVFFFLGCLLFGAAMFLLGQIFHVTSSNYDAIWWWALCTLPFALLLDTALLHLLFAALLSMWIGFEILSLDRLIWRLPSAGYSVPFLIAPGVVWAYRKNSDKVLSIYVPVLTWWLVLQPIAWKLHANPTYFIGATGALLLLAAALHPARSAMAIPYRFYGVTIVGGTLIPLSFHAFNEAAHSWNERVGARSGVEQVLFILILGAVALIAAYFLQRKSHPDDVTPRRTLAESLRESVQHQAVPLGLLALFVFLALWSPLTHDPWVPTIAANAAMVAIAFWLIRLGLAEERGRPFGAGVAYLLLWAVLRYIDLFGQFGGMLGAALMFFLCGAALFGVALYWRQRKAVSLA